MILQCFWKLSMAPGRNTQDSDGLSLAYFIARVPTEVPLEKTYEFEGGVKRNCSIRKVSRAASINT